MSEEDPKIRRDLLKRGQGVFCVQTKLCIGMPASHDKNQIKDCLVVWGREKAIKDWECTLLEHQSSEVVWQNVGDHTCSRSSKWCAASFFI